MVRGVLFAPAAQGNIPQGHIAQGNIIQGDLIATAGDDGVIRFWDFDRTTGQFEPQGQWVGGVDQGSILSLAYSPDGQSLLSTSDRGNVTLHHLPTGRTRVLLNEPDVGPIWASRFSSDGVWVATGGADMLARLWNVAAWAEELGVSSDPILFRGHAEPIEDLAILADGRHDMRLFTAGRDQSVRVWDPQVDSQQSEGRELLELRGHTDGLTAIDVTADGVLLLTAGRDGTVMLWTAPLE